MKHVVLYSGGMVSWKVADLVISEHGTDDVVLLFTDTTTEDPDLYRFLRETSEDFGVPITRLADGRTPWQVFWDVKFIGNTRVDPCSRVLKREPTRKWIEETCDPNHTIVYVGFDIFEAHRYRKAKPHWEPWTLAAPLVDQPITRKMLEHELSDRGIAVPRLYKEGFGHNNCGGACVKAGQGQWAHLLKVNPELYAYHEEQERQFRETFQKDVSILKSQVGGEAQPLTLEMLRERVEADQTDQIDLLDWRGCGCFWGEEE